MEGGTLDVGRVTGPDAGVAGAGVSTGAGVHETARNIRSERTEVIRNKFFISLSFQPGIIPRPDWKLLGIW